MLRSVKNLSGLIIISILVTSINAAVLTTVTATTYLTNVTIGHVGCDSDATSEKFAYIAGAITDRNTGVVSADQFAGWVVIQNKEMYATFLNIKNNGGTCTAAYLDPCSLKSFNWIVNVNTQCSSIY